MLSVGPKVDLEWSGDRFRGLQSIFEVSRKGKNALCGPQSWFGVVWRPFSGTSERFWDFPKRQKCSLWAPKLIWSGHEIVFGDLRAFSRFPEKAEMLSVGPKLIWSGLETVFGEL